MSWLGKIMTMLFKYLLISGAFLAATVHGVVLEERATGGYVQSASGSASFTQYTGCGSPGIDYLHYTTYTS